MEKISVLIVEDQLLVAKDLKNKLEDHNFDVLPTIDNGEDAIEAAIKYSPDLIIMDIRLAGELDGIETASIIKKKQNIPIIYLSDHIDENTVDRAKKTFPANYLSKPYKIQDVLRALELAFFNSRSTLPTQSESRLKDRIFIRTDRQSSEMIPYDDILYVQADRSYTAVITSKKKYILSNSLTKVIDQFKHPDFMKIHRSYVINIRHITSVEGNIVRLGSDYTVQMSNQYRNEVIEILNIVR